MSKNTLPLKPFLKVIQSKPYIDQLNDICSIALVTVTHGCFAFWAYSDKHADHDRIVLGTRDDIVKWCRANNFDLNHSWLFSDMCDPAHELCETIATDILGVKIVESIAETMKIAAATAGLQAGDYGMILFTSLESIVERYLSRSIIWATVPSEFDIPNFGVYKSQYWFRLWTTCNALKKPIWAAYKPPTPEDDLKPDLDMNGDPVYKNFKTAKTAEATNPVITAEVYRYDHPEHVWSSVGYVGTIHLDDESFEEDLGQMIRQQYGAGDYKVHITETDMDLGAMHIKKTLRIKVSQGTTKTLSVKTKNPLLVLPPAEKIPLDTSSGRKMPKTPAPSEPEPEETQDVFTAAISGGLFKKDIEEP